MKDEVRLHGADLSVGESMRTECPSCGQQTLSITRDDEGLLYQCFRASCDTAGRASGRSLTRVRKKPERVTHYTGELLELDDPTSARLADLVGFDEGHLSVARPRLGDNGRVAYPMLGPLGRRRGWVLRGYDGQYPKALNYPDGPDDPHTSWYPRREDGWDDEVWLVEDIPSAVRASRYVDCVALLGTSLPVPALAELCEYYNKVVWALDADATATALANHRRYSIFFESSRVAVLEQDLKNMSEADLRFLLSPRGESDE